MCCGNKYEPIFLHWVKRIRERCGNVPIVLLNNLGILNNTKFNLNEHGIIWAIRFKNFLDFIQTTNNPVVMCDVDVIIEKDLQQLVDLPYDIIISKESQGINAYPKHCSNILGFGVCAGFGIYKLSSLAFLNKIYDNMENKKYGNYDDQVNIMEHIVNSKRNVYDSKIVLDNREYTNIIIEIDDIKICVLDFEIVIRDPLISNGQFANHINIDFVEGTDNFIKYFYNDLKDLPCTRK